MNIRHTKSEIQSKFAFLPTKGFNHRNSSPSCRCLPQQQGNQQLCLLSRACSALLGAALLTSPTLAAEDYPALSNNLPLADRSNIISKDVEDRLNQQLVQFERDTGWRIRVLTGFNIRDPGKFETGRMNSEMREEWQPDASTVIVGVDPQNPNIMMWMHLGSNVLEKLRRPFWLEMQSRFGNMYYVREQGEQEAVVQAVSTIQQCLLKPEGCFRVPGLTTDQFYFCAGSALVGGLFFGISTTLEATGPIAYRWLWPFVFAPLWASLFFSFGLGPILTRSTELLPVLGICGSFGASTFGSRFFISLKQSSIDKKALVEEEKRQEEMSQRQFEMREKFESKVPDKKDE